MRQNRIVSEKHANLVLRGIAISLVVLLHAFAVIPEGIYFSSYQWAAVAFNQFSRFSVPLFLALSGYGLARKYLDQTPSTSAVVKDRLIKLLPAYLIWSLILFIALHLSRSWQGETISWWQGLLLGKVDYHLYFVPLIMQCYLLFSLLHRFKNPKIFWSLVIASGIFQLAWFGVMRLMVIDGSSLNKQLMSDQLQYRFIFNWLYYFVLGMLLGKIDFDTSKSSIWIKSLVVGVTLGGFIWAIIDAHQLIELTRNVVFATSYTRVPVVIFSTGVILLSVLYGKELISHLRLNLTALRFIGTHSYLIYLSHTLALRIIFGLIFGGPETSTISLASGLLLVGLLWSRSA